MEGQRMEKKPGVPKKGLIIAGAVVGVLVAAYLGVCLWAGQSQSIFPHTSVAGVDVSGMTTAQAAETLSEELKKATSSVSLSLTYGHWEGTLEGSAVELDTDAWAQSAWASGRENFLLQGGTYLGRLMGADYDLAPDFALSESGQQQFDALMDEADQQVGGALVDASYAVEGEELVLTKGVTGVTIDRQAAQEAVLNALGEAVAATMGAEDARQPQAVELPAHETAPQDPDFDAMYAELHTEPQDAQVDPETLEVSEHVVGVDFDVEAAKAAFAQAAEGETVRIPLTITQPKETQESLKAKLFRDLLGEGTTKVSGSSNRKHNVKLSASACNGVVLMPGEVFSYNNTTGSRSADKGYLAAPVYSGGDSVDEVGGGICQTSSTIYYAVLHTTLEVVERHAHTYNTGYVTQGMDATVYYGSADFRFKNSTDYPVKIVTKSYDKNGARYLTVQIYGTNDEGVYAVPKSNVFDRVDPTTQYKADSSIPQGTTKVDSKQNAYIGWSSQTYRYVYDKDGNLLEKQDMGFSKYKMRPKTILYNPADGDPSTWVDGQPPKPGGTTDPGTGTTDPGTGTTDPGTGTTDPGTGTTDPGTGTTDPGTGTTNPGTGTTDPGTGTTDPGTSTTDPGTGTESGQGGASSSSSTQNPSGSQAA